MMKFPDSEKTLNNKKSGIELKSSAKDTILKDLPGKFPHLVNKLFKVQRLSFVVIF